MTASERTTEALIAEVKRLHEAATKGPWTGKYEQSAGVQIKACVGKIVKDPISFFEVPSSRDVHFRLNHETGELWATLAYESFVQFQEMAGKTFGVDWRKMQESNADLIASYRTLAPILAARLESAERVVGAVRERTAHNLSRCKACESAFPEACAELYRLFKVERDALAAHGEQGEG